MNILADGTPVLLPHPVRCTACTVVWATTTVPAGGRMPEIGGLIVCVHCGHLMVTGSDWHLYDLTPAEVRTVMAHPNWPNIREGQRQIARRICPND